jgi:hypothetical protein
MATPDCMGLGRMPNHWPGVPPAAAHKGEDAAEVTLCEPLCAISQEANWYPQTMPYQEIDLGGGRQITYIQIKHPQTKREGHEQFVEGYHVRIQELVGAQQHNGKAGVLKSFIEETQRWLFPSAFVSL